ncbi:MAG: hypothetical protein HY980_02200 [Candidatus Magasanikbacteria bacterium]|nr:hypothetical protein [Candidatus Magasanikbacteria bacterium]
MGEKQYFDLRPGGNDFGAEKKDNQDPLGIKEFWQEGKFQINGTDVETYGVAHRPETLQVKECRDKIESAISRSSIVLLEGEPDVTDKKFSFQEISDLAKFLGLEIPEQKLKSDYRRIVDKNPYADFFKQIQIIAADHQVRIASADPAGDSYKALLLQKCDLDVQEIKQLIMLLSTVGCLGSMGLDKILSFFDKNQSHVDVKQTPPATSTRRKFLKSIAGISGLAAFSGFFSSSASALRSLSGPLKGSRAENPIGFALYDLMDFRDVVVAEGLDVLSKKINGQGPIVVIYGSAHIGGIQFYAEHPLERKAKLLTYGPFVVKSDLGTRVYEFDTEWKLIENIDME